MLKITPFKLLATLASIGAVSVAAVGGTYANFTATPTTISSNAFTSGTLTMSRTGTGAIFSSSNMKIGDAVTGSVTITNTGTLAGIYSLDGALTGSALLAGQLHLVLYKDVDLLVADKLYDGSLNGVTSVSLGTFAATSGTHTYYFHIDLPTAGTNALDNAFQGLASTTTFTWSAVQA